MSGSIFSIVDQAGTLIAIFIGAILATIGALLADKFREGGERKRRERDAAKAFGQILVSLLSMLRFAIRSQGIGQPWGAVTVRFLKLCLRQGDWFEQNLGLLFDIENIELRHKIRTYIGAALYPIQTMVDRSHEIEDMRRQLIFGDDLKPHQIDWLKEQIEVCSNSREGAYAAALHQIENVDLIMNDLEALAGVKFDVNDELLLSLTPPLPGTLP